MDSWWYPQLRDGMRYCRTRQRACRMRRVLARELVGVGHDERALSRREREAVLDLYLTGRVGPKVAIAYLAWLAGESEWTRPWWWWGGAVVALMALAWWWAPELVVIGVVVVGAELRALVREARRLHRQARSLQVTELCQLLGCSRIVVPVLPAGGSTAPTRPLGPDSRWSGLGGPQPFSTATGLMLLATVPAWVDSVPVPLVRQLLDWQGVGQSQALREAIGRVRNELHGTQHTVFCGLWDDFDGTAGDLVGVAAAITESAITESAITKSAITSPVITKSVITKSVITGAASSSP